MYLVGQAIAEIGSSINESRSPTSHKDCLARDVSLRQICEIMSTILVIEAKLLVSRALITV